MKEKIFVSFKFTWVPLEDLEKEMGTFCDFVESTWRETFCSLFREDKFDEMELSIDERYKYCTDAQINHDIVLSFLNHQEPSTWMVKYELNQAKEIDQPMLLVVRKELDWLEKFKALQEYADNKLVFENLEELKETLPTFLNNYFKNKQQPNG